MNLLNRVQQLEFDSGVAWLFRAGRTGIICGMVGRGFYDEICDKGAELIREHDLDRIIAEVQDWHLRLMRNRLKDIEITEICRYEDGGNEFIEVELRPT